MVVSYTALLRLKALSALGMTKGARLMLSTPPAIISRLAGLDGARGVPTASRPEPHRRLMVAPGTSTGRPASRLPCGPRCGCLRRPGWRSRRARRLRSISALSGMAQSTLGALRAISALIRDGAQVVGAHAGTLSTAAGPAPP
jgi:hypothetical protein